MSHAQQEHHPHTHHRVGQLAEPDSDNYVVRRFPTAHVEIYGDDPTNLEIPGGTAPFSLLHVRCHAAPAAADQKPSCHTDSLVVAVHGICPPQNSPDQPPTRSAVGVYLGPNNIVNRACRIPDAADRGHVMLDTDGSDSRDRPQHTQQRADLYAAIAGLMETMRLAKQGLPSPRGAGRAPAPFKLHHVVVKSDSAYLVEGIAGGRGGESPHMNKWLANGWKTAKGEKVKNEDLWDNLMLMILALGKLGVAVEFWQVPKKENKEADRLAKYALEQDVNWFDEKDIFGKSQHQRGKKTEAAAKDELVAME
ncbi:hypothetical protein LZ32DRAFT_690601 [Colletotrichum eremochloae]|nr:hypothetical protein LZ32DRAFT_690601 [Colletotrichum eremochloae]